MPNELKEEIISKLTELLIKADFEEKVTKRSLYVKKTRAYKDLIKWFKENFWQIIVNINSDKVFDGEFWMFKI